MFYSETLLSKTGPLARVWLSANLERKLGKQHVLATNIENSVNAIVDQGQAPLALRLSGQLLLGVVRIYSRKARYLLDDCNEAIHKIKMVFQSQNVDLPAGQALAVNPESLTLPDALTELDLLAPLPDLSLLLAGHLEGPDASQLTITPSSRRLTTSIERPRGAADEPMLEDDVGLELDIGGEDDMDIEIGRDAPASRALEEEFDTTMQSRVQFESADAREDSTLPNLDMDGDLNMGGFDEDETMLPQLDTLSGQGAKGGDITAQSLALTNEDRADGPSDLFAPDETTIEDSVHQPQRAKKRKLLEIDADTQLRSDQIRALQQDRSKILKPITYLPKDPVLLALMEMRSNGSFVSNILGDGRSKGWAPELRGVLSLEIVRNPSKNLKQRRGQVTRIDVDEDDSLIDDDAAVLEVPGDELGEDGDHVAATNDGLALPGSEIGDVQDPRDAFEHTEYPLLHPAESGLISQGTRHAVHLLRDKFGADAAGSPSKRQKTVVLFQDLLPEKATTRADATKMFFEMLVLATKDAIKVEQPESELGGPLRVRGKRGLWGSWAEAEAGGEIERASTAVVS